MKKVFSIEKYKKSCEEDGIEYGSWANKCEGLTVEEIGELGFGTIDNWMIEVEERKNEEYICKEVKPADIPFEKYKALRMENEVLKDAIVRLTVKITALEKEVHPDVY